MSRRVLWSLLAALLTVAGCAEQSGNPLEAPAAGPVASIVQVPLDLDGVLEFVTLPSSSGSRQAAKHIVAAEGGYVELHGFRVDIPAGALPHDATVTITLPSDPLLATRVLAEFGPHGMQFNTPVTLSFPLQGVSLLPDRAIEVGRWENGGWTSLGGWVSADGGTLSATTPHFSSYSGKYVLAGG